MPKAIDKIKRTNLKEKRENIQRNGNNIKIKNYVKDVHVHFKESIVHVEGQERGSY